MTIISLGMGQNVVPKNWTFDTGQVFRGFLSRISAPTAICRVKAWDEQWFMAIHPIMGILRIAISPTYGICVKFQPNISQKMIPKASCGYNNAINQP